MKREPADETMTLVELTRDFRRFCRRLTGRSHSSTLTATADYPTAEWLLQEANTRLGAEAASGLPELIAG